MSYTPVFTPLYPNGWKDEPDETTPVIADALNAYDEAIENIEEYLENSSPSPGGDYVSKSGDTMTGDLVLDSSTNPKPNLMVGTRKSNTTKGTYSVAIGAYNETSGEISFAQGASCRATGICAVAQGQSAVASATDAHASGFYVTAGYAYQFVCGKNNDNKSTSLFEVGNGPDTSTKSNAFEVDSSGNAIASGNVQDGNGTTIAYLLSQINDLTARVAALEGN